MALTAGMIHVVPDNAALFGRVALKCMPDVRLVHFVDGGLPGMSAAEHRPRVIERLRTLARFARESGADAILLTCTAFGRLSQDVQHAVDCPVLSVLELVVDEVASRRGTVGIIGTHQGTLTTAARMLRERVESEQMELRILTRHCPGAFEAMLRGDLETHDRIVRDGLCALASKVDLIVAPQPSLERALWRSSNVAGGIPVLTSPTVTVLRLKAVLDALR